MKLKHKFYLNDVLEVSKSLLGKRLCTNINGKLTGGIICETEAYKGVIDKAAHSYGNKRTKRTETMFLEGGIAYVYLCYGIHHLFNIVVDQKDIPEAVLIRGIIPDTGIPTILKRRKRNKVDSRICIGPGKVSQALAISTADDNIPIDGNRIWVEESGISINSADIKASPRIGVDYAEEDALLPYRFTIEL